MLNVETEATEYAHVDVRHPHQGESRNHVATPIVEEKGVAGADEKNQCHVVAEAILAGEQVEELARQYRACCLAPCFAPLARLAKDLLVGDRPRDARDRERENEEGYERAVLIHLFTSCREQPVTARNAPSPSPYLHNVRPWRQVFHRVVSSYSSARIASRIARPSATSCHDIVGREASSMKPRTSSMK